MPQEMAGADIKAQGRGCQVTPALGFSGQTCEASVLERLDVSRRDASGVVSSPVALSPGSSICAVPPLSITAPLPALEEALC